MNPLSLNLKRTEKLEIEWPDGLLSTYPIALLRKLCPCAACRTQREEDAKRSNPLRILSGDFSKPPAPLSVLSAEMVGSYAIRLVWSDGHDTGIYSFAYLRDISPQKSK